MPGPGIYVVAVVVGVAAGVAFKEFVYDPHLAPKIERWTDAYAAYRVERRRRRAPPQSYSRVDSDDEEESRGHKFPNKDELELEGLVEREMHTLGGEGTLRQRKLSAQEASSLEMLERPNSFVPFIPLSPSPLRPPSRTFSTPENVTMPISRFPASQTEERPSSRVSAASARRPTTDNDTSASTPTRIDYSVSRITSSMSEHSFAMTGSRGASPFTAASDSRAGTPWSDVLSASSSDMRSGASVSDDPSEMLFAAEMEHPYLIPDHTPPHATTYSQISLSNESDMSLEHSEAYSESSFDTSFGSSDKTRSDVSVDSLEAADDQQVDLVDMLSPRSAPGMLSDDEWERVSEAGRSAHP